MFLKLIPLYAQNGHSNSSMAAKYHNVTIWYHHCTTIVFFRVKTFLLLYTCSAYHVKWTFLFQTPIHTHTPTKGCNAVMILVMALLSQPEWRHLALGMSDPVFLLLLWQQNEEIWEKEVPFSRYRHKDTNIPSLSRTHTHILNTSTVLL